MDLRDYLRILAKRWSLVAVLTVLGTATGIAATALATPMYEAKAQLFVSVHAGGADVTQLNQGNSFSQDRVKSYADIVTSPRVTDAVVRDLDLPVTADELAGRISAQAPANTVLIDISVKDPVAQNAADIANSVARHFADVVDDLERPSGAGKSPVHLGITRVAVVPSAPVSPRPVVNLVLGLLVGASFGVGLAVLLESLDTSVKSPDDLRAATQVPILGTVVFDRNTTREVLVTQGDQHRPMAEAFRQLRTNLRFVDVDRQPNLIAVTSSVPGEGKTTTSINLAASLAEVGISVCVVDGDLRRPSVASALGLVRDAGLTTVLIGQAELDDVLQSAGPNFTVLTSGPIPPNPSELLASTQMSMLLREVADRYDLVIVDTPPLLPVTDGAVLASQVDGALLVVRSGKTTRDQVARAAEALNKVGARVLGGVLNMAPTRGHQAYAYGYSYTYRPDVATRRRRSLRAMAGSGSAGHDSGPAAPELVASKNGAAAGE